PLRRRANERLAPGYGGAGRGASQLRLSAAHRGDPSERGEIQEPSGVLEHLRRPARGPRRGDPDAAERRRRLLELDSLPAPRAHEVDLRAVVRRPAPGEPHGNASEACARLPAAARVLAAGPADDPDPVARQLSERPCDRDLPVGLCALDAVACLRDPALWTRELGL